MNYSIFLYIDPQTGAMLFSILLGTIGTLMYFARTQFIRLKQKIMGFQKKSGSRNVSDIAGSNDLNAGNALEDENGMISIVIFAESKRYFTIFEPICRELDKLDISMLYITMSEDDPMFDVMPSYKNMHVECIPNQYKLYTRLNYLNAYIVFSTTPGLDVYQWKRSKNVKYYVHIQHSATDIVRYRMFGIDHYDAILLSGDYQIKDVRSLEKMRKLPAKDMVLVGVPYMDEMAKRLDEVKAGNTLKSEGNNTTILLAPTWGKTAILSVYGEKIIQKLLDTGYNLIIRPHPQAFISEKDLLDKLMRDFPDSDRVEWNRDDDNFDCLCRSDIMISDFSGVIFDYTLIHGKPVIYTDYKLDLSVYDAWWLQQADDSYKMWTERTLPKIGMPLRENELDNIKSMIDECLSNPRFEEARLRAIEETWAFKGEGAKKAAEYLFNKYNELVQGGSRRDVRVGDQ